MRIKFDVDGVLRDMLTPMIEIYNKEFGQDLCVSDIKEYDVDLSFPLIKERLGINAREYFFKIHEQEVVANAPACEGVVECLKELKDYGHKIIIVTFQFTNQAICDTAKWLGDHGIPYDEIHFTGQKWAVTGDVIVDDNVHFMEDERENAYKMCMSYPYNEYYKCPDTENFVRVSNIYDACSCIMSHFDSKEF